MPTVKDTIATDSASELSKRIGDDATATFENDPKFIESNPVETASSENVEVQRSIEDSDDSDEELDDAAAEDEELDEDEEDFEEDADAAVQRT